MGSVALASGNGVLVRVTMIVVSVTVASGGTVTVVVLSMGSSSGIFDSSGLASRVVEISPPEGVKSAKGAVVMISDGGRIGAMVAVIVEVGGRLERTIEVPSAMAVGDCD